MRHFIAYFLHLGAPGIFFIAILDSSFLFFPTGNDILLILLTANNHEHVFYYVLAATCGSTIGVMLLDLVSRKGGEEGLKHVMSAKRLAYVKKKMKSNAGFMLGLAALSPPPFPFTAVIAAASAFQYPRWRLLGMVFVGRVIRFGIEGYIAVHEGTHILSIMKSPGFVWAMGGFGALCAIGSIFSVAKWIRRTPAH